MSVSSSSPDVWSASAYLRFDEPRTRPGLELIARVQAIRETGASNRTIERIADLGCGTGRFLVPLLRAFPSANSVSAVDSSSKMLDCGRRSLASEFQTRVDWQLGDIARYEPEAPVDLLFSNAALHWIPDHASLFPRLLSHVSPGGLLAVQVPNNFREPSHLAIREVISEMADEGKIDLQTKQELENLATVLPAQEYHQILAPECSYVDVFEVKYLHALEEPEVTKNVNEGRFDHPVLSWVSGSTLSPVLPRLQTESGRQEFLTRYSSKLHRLYPINRAIDHRGQSVHSCLFPFKRIFMIAVRK